MECTLALIADYAAVDAVGKLNIVGAFSDVFPVLFPASLVQVSIVAVFEGSPVEAGTKKLFEITLIGGDAKQEIFHQQFESKLPDAVPGQPVKANVLFTVQGLTFDAPGDYRIYFRVNGESKRDIPIRVHPVRADNQAKGTTE